MIQAVTALSLAVVAATVGTAIAATPTGKVKPNMHLTNGQTVKASGAGFTPQETIYIVECNKTVAKSGENACDLNNLVVVTSNAKGNVPASKFTVQTGTIGNGTCGTGKADKECYIVLSNEALTETALVRIVFTVP